MKEIKNSAFNLRKKSYWLMKTLEKEFSEEANISFDERTLLSFVNWALEEGFLDRDIRSALKRALLRCQCESIGYSMVSHSECILDFQSVIFFARSFLNRDLNCKSQRWKSLVSLWKNHEAVSQVDEKSQTLEEFFASLGFNSLGFHLYSQFKKQTLSPETTLRCSKKLSTMLQIEKVFEARKFKNI